MTAFIDITLPVRPGMLVWPGDEAVRVDRMRGVFIGDMERGDAYNLSRLVMGLHAGTHLDAPLHFLRHGNDVTSLPLETAVGPCRVIEIAHRPVIDRRDLEPFSPREGERLIFKTRNSSSAWWREEFDGDYANLTPAAARYLAERGLLLVGIDYLSVAPWGEGTEEVHRALLEAGVWILEGLDLRGVEPGDYELLCLPLKVEKGEGAPARAILKPLP